MSKSTSRFSGIKSTIGKMIPNSNAVLALSATVLWVLVAFTYYR